MGAVLSSAAVGSVVKATRNYAQQRWIAPRDDAAASVDWSGLPSKLLVIVMEALDIPSLVRFSAVCTSWHGAYATLASTVVTVPNQVPYLLYAYGEYGPKVAAAADWCALPEDLLLIVMEALDLPSLARSSAVCTSWRDAYDTFRYLGLPSPVQAPCLLYACDEYGPNDAALYCPSTNSTFRVPFPGPPHEKRGFVFSCNGWVFAADEVGNPYIFNPITGVQAALPPARTITGIHRDENFYDTYYDSDGKHVFVPEDPSSSPAIIWARDSEYYRVAISAADEVTACTVLIVDYRGHNLSYARPGDERWTFLPFKLAVRDVLYNEDDSLFYVLRGNGSVLALDLNGPSPSWTAMILGPVVRISAPSMYLALTPEGELLQVWRMWDHVEFPLKDRSYAYQDIVKYALEGCIDFVAEDDYQVHTEAGMHDQDIEVPQVADDDDDEEEEEEEDGDDDEEEEVNTHELVVFKVDVKRQKLLELRDIGDHALFLGFNASICLPTKDFSGFKPNCAYLTDDCCTDGYNRTLRSDHGIWNIKKRSMEKLDDAWAGFYSCLALPAPIWIRPTF